MAERKGNRSRAQQVFLILFILSALVTASLLFLFWSVSGRNMTQAGPRTATPAISSNTPVPAATPTFSAPTTPTASGPIYAATSDLLPTPTFIPPVTPSSTLIIPVSGTSISPVEPTPSPPFYDPLLIALYASLGTNVLMLLGFVVTTRQLLEKSNGQRRNGQGRRKAGPKQRPAGQGKGNTGCVLISYRRSDSADAAGRIYDSLVEAFGEEVIFKDVDSIPLGVDFKQYLDRKVGESSVFLAIIGDDWLEAVDEQGRRRLDDPDDFVRIEVESALARNIPVIPLLVRGAKMPGQESLPPSLGQLVHKNGIPVRADPDFHNDMQRLISGLEKYVYPDEN